MSKKANNAPAADETITLQDGGFKWDVPRDMLGALPATGVSSGGIILANVRQKVSIVHGDMPVNYTLSVYITRDGIGNDERAQVTDAKDASAASKKAKSLETAAQHEKDIQSAVQRTKDMVREGLAMGRADAVESISNVAKLAPSLKAIKDLATSL